MAAHAKLGASSMYRWEACPGSIRESQGKENEESAYAAQGTLAHDYASDFLMGLPQKTPCEREMWDNLIVYFGEVQAQVQAAGFAEIKDALKHGALFVEARLDLSSVHPDCFGTGDAVVWNAKERLLSITDLKYGAGLEVEVVDNVQLQYYALGAMLSLGLPAIDIDITIVQPRCPHPQGAVRKWRISAIDLLEFEGRLIAAAKATEDPEAPLVTGSHCRFCPAKVTCPKLHQQAMQIARTAFEPVGQYDAKDLAKALSKVDVIEGWCKAVRAAAYREASRGREIPGWKLVDRRPTRKWKPDLNAFQLHRLFGIAEKDFLDEPALKSPAQVEKMLEKPEREKLAHCCVKESSGTKLVREDEPGVPISTAMGFSKIEPGSFDEKP